uniref:G protein-coupled receptor n=1 Tax=Steinernema glaseri TaxID=37863 RepID=A0A1I7XXC3_9BILA
MPVSAKKIKSELYSDSWCFELKLEIESRSSDSGGVSFVMNATTGLSWDNALIGLLYFVSNSVALSVYSVFLLIFVGKEPYRSSVTFKIMFFLGVVECIQLVSGVQEGIMSLSDSTINYYFEMIGGAFNCVGLFGRPLFLLILALNRGLNMTDILTSRRKERILFSVLLAIASLLTILVFVYRVTIGKAYYQLKYDTFRLQKTTGFAAMIKHIT